MAEAIGEYIAVDTPHPYKNIAPVGAVFFLFFFQKTIDFSALVCYNINTKGGNNND